MKLSVKFMLVLLTVSLVPVLCLGYISYLNSRRCLDVGIFNHLKSINILKMNDIDTWIDGSVNTLEILSKNVAFDETFKNLISKDVFSRNETRKFFDDMTDRHIAPLVESLFFQEFMVIRAKDGRAVISTDPDHMGKFFENRPYFIRGIKGTFVQNVYYSMATQEPSMVISTPLKDPGGAVYAVLVGRLDLSSLSRIMELGSGESESEESYLVNTFNFFVTAPRSGRDFALKKSVHTEGVMRGLNRESGIAFYKNYRNVPVIGAYTWLDERELVLITEVALKEAFEPIESLKKQTVIIGFFIAALTVAVSMFSSRALTRPMASLAELTREIGQGNFDIDIKSERKDEIGELTNSFEVMVNRLKETLVSKNRLEEEIVEREKAQENLRATLKELEQSNMNLEQFAYVASHDLQEPLRMVSSYCQLLHDKYDPMLDERGKKYIFYAVDGASRMQKLINDLLDFSRVTRKGNKMMPCKAQKSLNNALKNLEAAIGEAAARITWDPLGEVTADSIQLTQVFQNLIGNALKFKTDKPPEIHVSSSVRDQDVLFSVQDNGIGIDSQYKEKIFIIFQRLHGRSEYPGTGIGLALCKRIVERHGGDIWFESTAGRGTTFYFTLKQGDAGYDESQSC